MTLSRSPGRGPKVSRFSACSARLRSSIRVPAGVNFLVPRATREGRASAKAETKTAAAYFPGPECIRYPATAEGGPEDLEPGAGKKLLATRLSALGLQPSRKPQKLRKSANYWSLSRLMTGGPHLGQIQAPVSDFVLQVGSELVDVSRGDIHGALEQGGAAAAHCIATHLHQQRLYGVGIKFLRRQTNNFTQRAAHRDGIAVRAFAGHGIERVSQCHNAHAEGNIVECQTIGVSRPVTALVMPAHDFRDAWPWKLHAAQDLVAHHRVISHLAELVRIKHRWLAEQPLVHRHLPDIVQVARRAQGSNLGGIQVQGFADGGSVTPDANRMPMNVDVLHVDGGGERLQGGVIEPMERSQQPQIFRHPLGERLAQRVVLDSERDVVR